MASRTRLALANMLGAAEMRRRVATDRFDDAEAIARLMRGLSDAEAEQYFRRMISDAEPGEAQAISAFVDAIRKAKGPG